MNSLQQSQFYDVNQDSDTIGIFVIIYCKKYIEIIVYEEPISDNE